MAMGEDGSLVPGLGGDNDDGMEGLEGLIDGDPDGDVDMMSGEHNRRRSLPSIRTDFSASQTATNNPAGGYAHPSQGNPGGGGHHNTYPPLNNPPRPPPGSNPATQAALFQQQHLGVKPPPSSSTQQNPGAAGAVISPHGVLTDSPRAATPQDANGGAGRGGGREREQPFSFFAQNPQGSGGGGGAAAPTANMGAGQGANLFAAGMDGVWGYIMSLEDRVRALEATVAELRAERGQGKSGREQVAEGGQGD